MLRREFLIRQRLAFNQPHECVTHRGLSRVAHIVHSQAGVTKGRDVPERGKVTFEELSLIADETARQLLGVSRAEAFAMLDRGELDGTLAGGTLESLRWQLAA